MKYFYLYNGMVIYDSIHEIKANTKLYSGWGGDAVDSQQTKFALGHNMYIHLYSIQNVSN